jgi:hypothetical protein
MDFALIVTPIFTKNWRVPGFFIYRPLADIKKMKNRKAPTQMPAQKAYIYQ